MLPPAKQTLLLTNLSERTSHKDLVEVLRGGRLLEIQIRKNKTATISFVEGAQDFLNYAKRKDIYVQNKLVRLSTAFPEYNYY